MGGLWIALLLQAGSVPIVPDGWIAEPYVTGLPGAMDVQWTPEGALMVGAFNLVVIVDDPAQPWTVRAEGAFADFRFAQGSDGTLWIADTEWVSFTNATLWRVPVGQTEPVIGAGWFKYCTGVIELPGGDILAIDQGFVSGGNDGRILAFAPDTIGAATFGMPSVVSNPLTNPLTLRWGPDGRVYFLDVGYYGNGPDGRIYRFTPGDASAELFLDGFNDPHDIHWRDDGTAFILDNAPGETNCGTLWRYDPVAGDLSVWASQFPRAFGATTDENGWAYVADPWSGYVWRIRPETPAIQAAVMWTPQTLNLGSRGNPVDAHVTLAGVAATAQLTAVDGSPVGPIEALSIQSNAGGFRARFDRAAIQSVLTAGERTLRIEGTLADGTAWWAEAPITAIQPQ